MKMRVNRVASFAEAWIEIFTINQILETSESPPSRRRGLKFELANVEEHKIGRLLRGGVD